MLSVEYTAIISDSTNNSNKYHINDFEFGGTTTTCVEERFWCLEAVIKFASWRKVGSSPPIMLLLFFVFVAL
jgi:hypothetical protein